MGLVAFNNMPGTIRSPLFYAEVNAGVSPYSGISRTILFGRKTTAGSAPLGKLIDIGSSDPNALFGPGSMLADMALFARNYNPTGAVLALPVADPAGASAGTGTFAMTGPATSPGTLTRYVAGERYDVAVASGDTATTIAANLASAINAGYVKFNRRMLPPVVAAAATGTVTLTARHGGTESAMIKLEAGLDGNEVDPAGVVVAITAMAAGSGIVDIAAALANMGAEPGDWYASPYASVTQLNAAQSFFADSGSCAQHAAFFAQLELLHAGATNDISTGLPDAPNGPLTAAFAADQVVAGSPFATWIKARYSLTDAQMAGLFTAAQAVVTASGQFVQQVTPNPAAIGALSKTANLSDLANVAAARVYLGLGILATQDFVPASRLGSGAAAANLGFAQATPGNGDISAATVTRPGGVSLALSAIIGGPCLPIDLFGADPSGATFSDAAWTAIATAIGSSNGCVGFGPGTYKFAAALYKALAAGQSIAVQGAGQDVSNLYWPTGGGLTLGRDHSSTFAIRSLSFLTGAQGGSNAINLNDISSNGCAGGISISTIENVAIRGADGIGATDYWANGIYATDVNLLNTSNVSIFGESTHSRANGMVYQGSGTSSSTTCLAVGNNNRGLYPQNLAIGYLMGQSAQGTTFAQSSFNADNNGITTVSNGYALDMLVVSDGSQFSTYGDGISLTSSISAVMISSSYFLVPSCCSGVHFSAGVNQASIIGNHFTNNTDPQLNATTGGNGVSAVGHTGYLDAGAIVGNDYQNFTNGNYFSNATNWNVQSNKYVSVSTRNNTTGGCTGCTIGGGSD